MCSGFVIAEASVWSPRKVCIQYLKKYVMDQSIQKIFYLILKKEALAMCTSDIVVGDIVFEIT